MYLFKSNSLGVIPISIVSVPPVQFSRVRIPNMSQHWWHNTGFSRIVTSYREQLWHQKKYSAVPLSIKWRSAEMPDQRSTARLAAQVPPSGPSESYLYFLQISPVLLGVLPQQSTLWVCLSRIPHDSASHDKIRNVHLKVWSVLFLLIFQLEVSCYWTFW